MHRHVPAALPCLPPPTLTDALQVFDGTVGGDVEALGRLTEDDLRFLVCACGGARLGVCRCGCMRG